MRVALALGSSAGGVGRHVEDLVSGLSAAGHDVLVACPTAVAEHFGLVEAGARHIPVEIAALPHPWHDARAAARLRQVAAHADVVHAHGLRAGALCSLVRRPRTPVVVTLHNAAPAGPVARRVFGALERIVAARADLVLGVSADLVDRQRALGARQVDIAFVAAPPPSSVAAAPDAVRAGLDLAPGRPLVVNVGRLADQKNHGLLLDVAAALTDLRPHPLFVVAGEGPLRERLQERIDTEHLPVRLLGHRRDVPDLLAAADLVISTADWEGQPVWIQEALHQGAAIVATDGGGTGAVLGSAAELVAVGDRTGLIEAVRHALADPLRRERMRERSRGRSLELPTSDDAVAAATAAYRLARRVVDRTPGDDVE